MKKFIPVLLFAAAIITAFVSFQNSFEIKKEEQLEEPGALEALNFWTRMRAYPNKDIPKSAFMKAFQNLKEKRKTERALFGSSNPKPWEAKGPLNVPGRTISLAVNPQNSKTLYAGAATGGLWRTYNSSQGGHWQRVETGFPTLGVMAIAIDPTDSNNIYIGTGETYGAKQSIGGYVIRTTRGSYGIGILKTTDGGRTWVKSLDWFFDQQRGVEDIAINPKNPKTIFAATSIGIYRSYDAGSSWEKIKDAEMGEDIIVNPADTNKILVSTGNLGSSDAGIYRSTDGGDTWTKLKGIPYFTGKTLMDYYAANPNIVYATVADSLTGKGLYKTTDFGDTWTLVNSDDIPRYQGFFAHWVAVKPTDSNQIVYAGVNITKSYDGGKTLTTVGGTHVDHHNYAHDPNNPNVLYIACDGGVYRSTNFGSSYSNIGYGLQTSQFYNGFSSSYADSNFAMGGLQDNNTVIFTGKSNWKRVIGGDGSWSAINPLNDNQIFGSWQYANIERSDDRGNSFVTADNGIGGDPAFIAPFVISESSPNILYAGTNRVYKTTNSGDHWTEVSSIFDNNQVISMYLDNHNAEHLIVATAPVRNRSHIFLTTDGGQNWTNITHNLPDRYPMDIIIDPNDSKVYYVVYGGYGTGHVFKSTDGGASWQNITGTLEDVPTLSITIDPLNSSYVYVGSDLGVFVSTDGGATWHDYNDGLPETVMAMDLNISRADRKLWVATHGCGAYKRNLLYKPDFYVSVSPFDLSDKILQGTNVTFKALVKNLGAKTQSENFTIEALLFDPDMNKVYDNTQTFCCLAPGGADTLTFDGNYTFETVGNYTFELIKNGNLQMPGKDTSVYKITVFQLPTIAKAKVTKIDRTYEPITTGTTFNGDDVQQKALLPFKVKYDNFEYDKVQMSTNGWIEFGTGQDGTLRGLSTSSQIGNIGANQNGSLASTSRPTKVLGPWWEDLNADGNGKVRYTTIGTAPNRVFVCQWEHMRAYYDANTTTTRVNFQVRIYENDSKILFCYGPVERGTFSGPDIGAMIGFKDHIGGDYHFYDIAAGGVIPASQVVTNLSPLTDWPSENKAYEINASVTGTESQKPDIPSKFVLYQNYPNPFGGAATSGNPATTIRYTIPAAGITNAMTLRLTVYDVLGREVKTLINRQAKPGTYSVTFSAGNLASGIYFYKLRYGNYSAVKKMILLK